MQTVLVPFDFTNVSENALRYAGHLSKFFSGQIILFHTFHVPAYTHENAIIAVSQTDFMQKNQEALKAVKSKLIQDFGSELKVKVVVKEGFLLDLIDDQCKEHKVDLIVSGIKAHSGFVKEHFLGSNSVEMAQHCKCPVLIIPDEVEYKKIQKIGFACDYKSPNNTILDVQAKYFKVVFNCELIMVNVMGLTEEISIEKAKAIAKLEEKLDHTTHQTVFVTSENIVEGLVEVIEDRKLDVLIVHPHKHSILDKMIHKSITKSIAFNSPVPILAVHENFN